MDRILTAGTMGFGMDAGPMGAYELELRAHMVTTLTGGGGGAETTDASNASGGPSTKAMLKAGMDFAMGKPVKAMGDLIGDDKSTFAKPSDYINVGKQLSPKFKSVMDAGMTSLKDIDITPILPKAEKLKEMAGNLKRAADDIDLKGTTNLFKNRISQARIVITAVDWVIKKLFDGYSVVDELLKKPFGGDWGELDAAAQQWDGLAKTLPSVADSLDGVASTIQSGAWEGQAADRCAAANAKAGTVTQAGAPPSSSMAQALRALANNAENLFDFVLDIIDEIISVCELIAGELASIVGTLALPVTVAYHAYVIGDLINRAVQLINNLITMAKGFASCLLTMNALAQQAAGVKAELSAGA